MSESNRDTAIEIQHKFEFYLIALVFTILGLSIQTGELSDFYYQYLFEISSWACLLLSGVFGLSRLEWKSVLYEHFDAKDEEEKKRTGLKQGIEGLRPVIDYDTGRPLSSDEIKEKFDTIEGIIIDRDQEIAKQQKRSLIKYGIHKYGFTTGLILLIVSRTILKISENLT